MEEDAGRYRAAANETADLVASLFEQYHSQIFAYLYRLVDNRELAHDLTQETFLRLLQHGDRLRQVDNRRAWTYRVASNLAFNALKRQRRFAWLPWRHGDGEATGSSLTHPGPAQTVAEQEAVQQALATLSPTYRAPLLLYSHYQLSVREVAAILEISESNVKIRLHRARQQFREAYGEA
ncbi:MAG: RNA polymerase sigma factor [Chloroflexota bacterium]